MKLRRFSSSLFSLPLITELTSGMISCCSRSVGAQIAGVIVLFAELTLPPVGMSASVQRSFSPLKQEVVSAVRTDDKILGPVVRSDMVPVVDFFGSPQIAAQGTFSHENVLVDIPTLVCSGMLGCAFLGISAHMCHSASPVRITAPTLHDSMTFVKHQGLTPDVASRRVGLLGERSGQSATTLTNTRRIQQRRAPNVCADSGTNLTHSGGFCG